MAPARPGRVQHQYVLREQLELIRLDRPPDSGGDQYFAMMPLGRAVEQSLAEALLCLGDFIFEKTNDMRDQAAMIHKCKLARELQNA